MASSMTSVIYFLLFDGDYSSYLTTLRDTTGLVGVVIGVVVSSVSEEPVSREASPLLTSFHLKMKFKLFSIPINLVENYLVQS